jgi:transposase
MDEPFPAPDGISAEDWAAPPASVHTFVGQLATRILALEARLNQTSQNPSKPPTSDPPDAPPRPTKTPRGRLRGGQPDHPGTTRERREPDTIVLLHPTICPQCATALAPTLPDATPPHITQVWELPPITPIMLDYVQHKEQGSKGTKE